MTVFAVQHHQRREGGRLVDKYDLSPAEAFGRVEYLLEDSLSPFEPDRAIDILDERLEHFSDDDFLLLVGNPVFIGLATAIAAANNDGRVNLLQWNGKRGEYRHVSADLN